MQSTQRNAQTQQRPNPGRRRRPPDPAPPQREVPPAQFNPQRQQRNAPRPQEAQRPRHYTVEDIGFHFINRVISLHSHEVPFVNDSANVWFADTLFSITHVRDFRTGGDKYIVKLATQRDAVQGIPAPIPVSQTVPHTPTEAPQPPEDDYDPDRDFCSLSTNDELIDCANWGT